MENVRNKIIEAVEEFVHNGGKVIHGEFGIVFDSEIHQWKSPKHCACALGALILKYQPNANSYSEAVEIALGESPGVNMADFFGGFINGFDGVLRNNSHAESYRLGEELALKFNPVFIDLVTEPDEDEEDPDYGHDDDVPPESLN